MALRRRPAGILLQPASLLLLATERANVRDSTRSAVESLVPLENKTEAASLLPKANGFAAEAGGTGRTSRCWRRRMPEADEAFGGGSRSWTQTFSSISEGTVGAGGSRDLTATDEAPTC